MDYELALAEFKKRPLRVVYTKLEERLPHYIRLMEKGRRIAVLGVNGQKTGVMYFPVVPPGEE